RRLVFGIHKDVSELRIGGGSTPVYAPCHAGEDERRRSAVRPVKPGCVRSFVAELRTIPQFLARLRVRRRRVFGSDEIFFGHADSGDGPWFYGDWLCWWIPLAGHIALCNRAFLDAVNRLSGFAIQNEHESRLSDLSESGNRSSILLDIDQTRCRRQVVIPKLMMDVLEVPL